MLLPKNDSRNVRYAVSLSTFESVWGFEDAAKTNAPSHRAVLLFEPIIQKLLGRIREGRLIGDSGT